MTNKNDKYYSEWAKHRYISRRGLLKGLFRPLVEELSSKPPPPSLSRPPGAVKSPLFEHYCNHCNHCIDACPMGIIVTADDQFPTLMMEYASCNQCKQCIIACQSGALQYQQKFDTHFRPVIHVSCINTRQHCECCLNVCLTKAMTINEDQTIQVNTERCNGCGECAIRCQQNAIELIYTN